MGGGGGGAWAYDCCGDGSNGAEGCSSEVVPSGLRAAAFATEAAAAGSRGTNTAASGTFGGCGRALAGAAGDSTNYDAWDDGCGTHVAVTRVLSTAADEQPTDPTDTEEVSGSHCSEDAEEGVSSCFGHCVAHTSDGCMTAHCQAAMCEHEHVDGGRAQKRP